MTTRRFMILLPLGLSLLLAQSYFWVPTYDQQARGNPGRLEEYIQASIGDAGILNPILSADSASSEINNLVFEGLIDRDENLHFRGRVAESWEITEEAYFIVNASARVPGAEGADADSIRRLLDEARRSAHARTPELQQTLANIRSVAVEPARRYELTRPRAGGGEPLRIDVDAPARIKLTLAEVDMDLFARLTEILGPEYFERPAPESRLRTPQPIDAKELAALAAELLPATEHNPVIEFRLRPGVRFHDGRPVRAEDVKFTYEAIMDPRNLSPRVADYEPVKSVEVLDPLRLRIVYKRLYSPAIGTWAMGILPAHLLDADALRREAAASGQNPAAMTMRQSAFNRWPVGCGPFVFREWKSDQYIFLDRFEDYWEGPPNYRSYAYRIIPDLLTQEMEFYAGTIDAYGVQPHQAERLSQDPRFQSFSGTSFSYAYIGYNLRRPPFDDLRVRRALTMALDVEKIIRFVLYQQGERTTGPFLKQTDFYNPEVAPVPYDPSGAVALLAEAGWRPGPGGRLEKEGRPLQFTLISNSGNDTRKSILAIAQDSWKQLGIDVRTDLVEWSVFIKERVNKLDFDALVLGWSMGIDPDLFQIWHSSQTGPHQLNFVGYANPEADELILRIRQEFNHERLVDYCRRLHAIIAHDQPYTFLYVPRWTAILDRRIVIRETDSAGGHRYRPITATRTGNHMFHFNQWIRLADMPVFTSR
ncbi:MAG: ABC transporter substrate-binding protein [Desulfobacterales bacterium]|nr:ABC transporter substrate-binding protein [Desulfobacterales bacterium]